MGESLMALKPHRISWDVYNPKLCGSRVTHTWSSWCWTAGGPAPQCNTLVFARFFLISPREFHYFLQFPPSVVNDWESKERGPVLQPCVLEKEKDTAPFFWVFWKDAEHSQPCSSRLWEHWLGPEVGLVTSHWDLQAPKVPDELWKKYLKSGAVVGNYISDWNAGVVWSNLSQKRNTDFWMHDQTG